MKLAGSRLGPYEIQSSIGAGGMGEVYRARDTRLDRLVAVKVIAGAAAFDPDFRERFDREARAISALDHPHICTLFDVGHEAGVDFLVMQLLEGHTLAERIARGARPSSDPSTASGSVSASTTSKGPVGIDQALRYGAEIAHALDAAHKRGIVHRDLKPGNIFVTKSGTKLLDFGLAKLAAQPAAAGLEDFPTRTVPLTGTGSIVGTLNYMAPEQLEGGPIDTRTDIFAFGAVLFEMVTGRRAFEAQSHAGLIAAILNQQPPALTDLSDTTRVLPASAHRALDRLIRKCLAKDPDDRWQSAADLAAELRWIDEERLRLAGQTEPEIVLLGGQPVSKRRERMWMATAAVALLAVAVTAAWALRPGPPEFPLRFAIPGDDLAAGVALTAVSPDGRHVAVVTGRAKGDMLTIRSMDSEELRVLAGTEGAWQPVWSPDSRSLVFGNSRNVGGQLKRVSVDGGPVMTVAHAVRGRPSWGSSDVILFSQEGTLFTVRANGGPVTPATQLDAAADEIGHAWPQFLPDGRRFLYLANHNDRTKNAIYLGTLGSPERTRIIAANSSFELSRGHLLFQRDGTVFAQRFDTDKGTAVGDPQPIVEGVAFNTANGRTTVSASANSDVLAYRLGGAALAGRTILQWVDLQGKPISMLGDGSWTSRGPAVSRDGLRVAIARLEEDGTTDLYVIDAERNVPTRLTATIGNDLSPVWSPDGAWIYFTSLRNNTNDIYRRAASGSGVDELVYPAKEPVTPTAISPDGEILLFTRGMGRETARDIWGMRLKGDRSMFQVVSTKFDDEAARFSPDGKWIAYQSDDVDERQVYAEPYPPTGDRVRLSPTSGVNPVWSADSRTVYYVDDRTKVMAVDVRAEGKTLHPSSPRELFTVNNLLPGASSLVADPRQPRFLTLVTPEERTPQPIKVIRNWQAALLK